MAQISRYFSRLSAGALFMLLLCSPALALHPAIPPKVDVTHQACKTLLEIAAKYKLEGVFPKEFEEGKKHLDRIELAATLDQISERLADKVVKEGSESVSSDDLNRLREIEEDLRSEMLLVHTRAFQSRNEGLGTDLHPITRNISMSGGLIGIFHSSAGYRETRDHATVVGRGDLVFNFKITDSTIAVIDVEATGGDGIDSHIASFSGLNAAAGSTGDRVRFRQAWVEHSMLEDRLIATIGKIDLTSYFDNNTVANDENSQFLASAFVNAHALSAPDIGPGVRLHAKLNDYLVFGIGYGSGDGSGNDIAAHGFGIAELDAKLKVGEVEGNYRLYGAVDSALPDGEIKLTRKNAYNTGVSIDQQLTGSLTLFGRYGQRERNVYQTSRSWSTGFQYAGLLPGRDDDIFGAAYGQISGKGLPAREKLIEAYYGIKLHDKISIAPIYQYLINSLGSDDARAVTLLGLRSQVIF